MNLIPQYTLCIPRAWLPRTWSTKLWISSTEIGLCGIQFMYV
jgi:hypothetical protein